MVDCEPQSVSSHALFLCRFLGDILMPNILYVDDRHRDTLVLHAINQQDPALDDILSANACIPATPTGQFKGCGFN